MTEPIRVLQVFHGMDCGGAENMIMNLYRHIDRSRVQFDFLVHTRKKCYFDNEIKQLGGRIFHVPYFNVANTASYEYLLRRFFESHPEITIVHGHLGSCSHIYLKIAKEYGCYAIAHSHKTKPTKVNAKTILFRLFTMQTRKTAEYFFACGHQAAEHRFGHRIASSDRLTILNNAIETERYKYNEATRQKMRTELGLEDCFVVGHVGGFNYSKNHAFLIQVFAELLIKQPSARLLLIGDGALRPAIEHKSENLGIRDKIIFTGVRSDVAGLMQAMDCIVYPSLFEGLPIALIEAQAAGLPIVCSDAVTAECKLTELVKYVPLTENAENWADAILSHAESCGRGTSCEEIIAAGYDITETSKWLEDFYLSHSNMH